MADFNANIKNILRRSKKPKVYTPNINAVRRKQKQTENTDEKTVQNVRKNEAGCSKNKNVKVEDAVQQNNSAFSTLFNYDGCKSNKPGSSRSVPGQHRNFDVNIKIREEPSRTDEDLLRDYYESLKEMNIKEKLEKDEKKEEGPLKYPSIYLVQLPDFLPFLLNNEWRNLQNAEEGMIGKMTIRKSGKCEAVIGKCKFDVDILDESVVEEVVCVSGNEAGYDFVELGKVNNRMMFSPDWDFLINTKNKL